MDLRYILEQVKNSSPKTKQRRGGTDKFLVSGGGHGNPLQYSCLDTHTQVVHLGLIANF